MGAVDFRRKGLHFPFRKLFRRLANQFLIRIQSEIHGPLLSVIYKPSHVKLQEHRRPVPS
jgi:hypothetical protein